MAQNSDIESKLAPSVRSLQIIVPALSLGALSFLTIVLFIQANGGGNAPQDGFPILTSMAFAMAAGCVVARFIVPNVMTASALRQTKQTGPAPSGSQSDFDVGQFAGVYVSKTIVGAALLEGASFFAITSYLIEGNLLCVALAGVLIVGVALHFPTTSKVAAWIEEKRRQLEEERHLAR